MIKHVVMWKMKENSEEITKEFLDGLKGLVGKVEGLVDIETGSNPVIASDYDAILISTFTSLDALQAYNIHPEHQELAKLCKTVAVQRSAFDYYFE